METDECLSNPCVNGGTCNDGINGYSCVCPENYKGLTCSDEAFGDPCVPNPCPEGNNCVKDETSSTTYTCQTPDCDQCPGIKICGESLVNGILTRSCQCPDNDIPRFVDEDCTQCDEKFTGDSCEFCAPGMIYVCDSSFEVIL